jgi:riboflavin synthase
MFTGIIETKATLEEIKTEGTNVHFTFSSAITPELKVDQSVSHNGVCLTVTETKGDKYNVTAIQETLKRTNLGELKKGDVVNLERCMKANGRFDGHIVQGHVDCTAKCTAKKDRLGSHEFVFRIDPDRSFLIVEKGSITVNGVSLTVVQAGEDYFSVHIIPYTLENTNFQGLKPGHVANIEFDIIGKYVQKMLKK